MNGAHLEDVNGDLIREAVRSRDRINGSPESDLVVRLHKPGTCEIEAPGRFRSIDL